MPNQTILLSLILFFSAAFAVGAQEDSGYTSTVNWFYSACEDRMVMDFDGIMQPGYDLYFQAFDQYGGLGQELTELRRVNVDGEYAASLVTYWLNGQTRALGTPISVVIRIGREDNPDSTIFQQPSDDLLGECEEPAAALIEDEPVPVAPRLISSAGVFRPDGGLLNPVYSRPPERFVHIGARPSQTDATARTANPGLIFAECQDVDGADPGLLYDTDELRVFWSWFAKTALQVREHIDNAQYGITLNGQAFPLVRVSNIKQIPDSENWWVFYTVNLGDKWTPGDYDILFSLTWARAITDGYENFGPGTANERMDSGCQFTVQKNPYGIHVMPENPSYPLKAFS